MTADILVIGAGPAGATAARVLAEQGKRICVWERRAQIGGNTYDRYNQSGILEHVYGPHIFHTQDEGVYAFLSRFTDWYPLRHRVLASMNGQYVPVPFNFDSIDMCFDAPTARRMRDALTRRLGEGGSATIMALMKDGDDDLKVLAKYVYEHVFLYYTQKQWGTSPDRLDGATTARVPVRASREDGYFTDRYQGMPLLGFTEMFRRVLDHQNIELSLNTDAQSRLSLRGSDLYVDGKVCHVPVIYTGALDELIGGEPLPYRTLDFEFETLPTDSAQPAGVINYTMDQAYTRVTEFKKLTGQCVPGVTTIAREYSRAYQAERGDIPYYPIPNEQGAQRYAACRARVSGCKNLYPLGRLAEYQYYNIDAIVRRALDLAASLA